MPSKKDKLGMEPDVPTGVGMMKLDHTIYPDGRITCTYYVERVDVDGNDAGVRQGDIMAHFTPAMTNAQKKLIEDSKALFIAGETP